MLKGALLQTDLTPLVQCEGSIWGVPPALFSWQMHS